MPVNPAHRHRAIWAIRILLIGSILANLAQVVAHLAHEDLSSRVALADAVSRNVETAFWGLVTLALTFLHDYFEKHQNVHIPGVVEVAMIVFLYASVFLSARLNLYDRVWWWDIVLHTISGVLLAFIGFLLVYKINNRYGMNLSPLLVALFAFSFSVTVNVLFEIYEFAIDIVFGTSMQSWDLPADTVEMGRSFQGIGLRDTMSDLIVDAVGAAAMAVVCFFLYRDERKKALELMKSVFPDA